MHFMAVKKSRKLSGLVVCSYYKRQRIYSSMVADNNNKFVNFRLNLNYFELKMK